MTIRIGLLGAGRIGRVHAVAIHSIEGAQLIAVADAIPQAAQSIATQYGCEVRETLAILDADDIDAVIIATPTDLHAKQIEHCCRQGKACFCEKPIDLAIDKVRECMAYVTQTNNQCMVAFNRRFDPDFMALQQALCDGKVGKIEMLTITSRDPGLPAMAYIERSGGIFRDMTIHDFDMAAWLLDSPITEVYAKASVHVDPDLVRVGDFDTAVIALSCQNGAQAVITNSRRASYGYDQRIEVLGSKAMVQANNHHNNTLMFANTQGFHQAPLLDFFMERYKTAYVNEMKAFVHALTNNMPMPVTVKDGYMALLLAEAAMTSVKENRVVHIHQ